MCGIGIKGVQMKILRTLLLSFALLPAIALAHPAEDLVRQITTDAVSYTHLTLPTTPYV